MDEYKIVLQPQANEIIVTYEDGKEERFNVVDLINSKQRIKELEAAGKMVWKNYNRVIIIQDDLFNAIDKLGKVLEGK